MVKLKRGIFFTAETQRARRCFLTAKLNCSTQVQSVTSNVSNCRGAF